MLDDIFYFLLGALALLGMLVWFLVREIKRLKTHTFSGIVRVGEGNGERVGALTANLDVALAKHLPKGLYVCEIFIAKKAERGVLYYGYNSVTNKNTLEVHVFDFVGDLYGKYLTIKTKQYLRAPKRFDTIERLREQIKKDLVLARKMA
ncbi:MAG: riboflavin kinase [Candidatus Magasanikbacteria bacterium]|nr:riboflavin kinase [Candidatus Magasanikbacteria bacterium]